MRNKNFSIAAFAVMFLFMPSNIRYIFNIKGKLIKNKNNIILLLTLRKLCLHLLSTNKNDMKTNIEIEIHEATLTNKVASVFYSITDEKGIADVKMNISKTDLMEQIKEDEMNFAYITAPDVLTELDAETFLEENLDNVIKAYLLYKFETA